jgi:hypothetical protein
MVGEEKEITIENSSQSATVRARFLAVGSAAAGYTAKE